MLGSKIKIDIEDFNEIYPNAKDSEDLVKRLNELLYEYGINTSESIAGFLAQTGHESMGWSVFIENLNYSESALKAVFGKYFPGDLAKSYARKPEKIANRVYANRMSNGNENSGDGWKYRGHGPIQLTGRYNISAFGQWLEENEYSYDVVARPDLITSNNEVLILSAIWYWVANGLTEVCNTGDIRKCTKIINGGYNGLDERIELFDKWMSILD